MDDLDRRIIDVLQGGFPLCSRPFRAAAGSLGCDEDELIRRVRALRESNALSRFGPMYNAERMGGALSLCAMSVPEEDFERVVAQVNAHPEVAHNYAREHALNMWFVLATETPQAVDQVLRAIEAETGLQVFNMPKEREYFVGLRFAA